MRGCGRRPWRARARPEPSRRRRACWAECRARSHSPKEPRRGTPPRPPTLTGQGPEGAARERSRRASSRGRSKARGPRRQAGEARGGHRDEAGASSGWRGGAGLPRTRGSTTAAGPFAEGRSRPGGSGHGSARDLESRTALRRGSRPRKRRGRRPPHQGRRQWSPGARRA